MSGTDYGPLAALIGQWHGSRGLDVSPEPEGKEESAFYETIVFEAAGDVDNAEEQTLAIVRYQQTVMRRSNDEVFHNEVGFWLWDGATGAVMQSFTIPRAVAVVAGGTAEAGPPTVLEVSAAAGDSDWGIVQSPFMRDNARTTQFRHRIEVDGDTLKYHETTVVQIYGREFEHTDENELVRT